MDWPALRRQHDEPAGAGGFGLNARWLSPSSGPSSLGWRACGQIAACSTLEWDNSGDPVLRTKTDYVATELAKCQEAGGYLGTYEDAKRWTSWDVWVHKCDLIGLVA